MSTKLTAQDIARIPPLDNHGEMLHAAKILKRVRDLIKDFSPEWQNWIADSLKVGIKVEQPEVPDAP